MGIIGAAGCPFLCGIIEAVCHHQMTHWMCEFIEAADPNWMCGLLEAADLSPDIFSIC